MHVVHEQAVEGIDLDIGRALEHLSRHLDALGYEQAGRDIYKQDDLERPALIMLPAVGNPGDATRLRQAGFRGYLVKPVIPADLRETLETLRRTPRGAWHGLFLTRHSLAEGRRGGDVGEKELDASLESLTAVSEVSGER